MADKIYMKGYKGFKKDMTCRGKQYSENTVFEEDNAVVCSSGMHFCENPMDVLDHYDLLDSDCELNAFAKDTSQLTSRQSTWMAKELKVKHGTSLKTVNFLR